MASPPPSPVHTRRIFVATRPPRPPPPQGIRFLSLQSDVLLTELYSKLSDFPDQEKPKVVTSWLANSYADLINTTTSDDGNGKSKTTELLNLYKVHIRLLNTLVQNSCFEKAYELANGFGKDFLYQFVYPSLIESRDGIPEATYFFQLVCENVTQPLLIRKLTQFAIWKLLPILISRLESKDNEVLTATLSLFKVLLEFYCEDLWYDLILQYLLPMKHLLVSDRQKALEGITFSDSTVKFLDLIPASISEALPPEVFSEHFVLYCQQELDRLRDIDAAVSGGIPLSKSEITGIPLLDLLDGDDNSGREGNRIYPSWAFKYDGTDVLLALRRGSGGAELEEYFEDDMFEDPPELSPTLGATSAENLETYDQPDFVSIEEVPKKCRPLAGASYENRLESNAYLGPFLDSLYKLLEDWTRFSPEVMCVVSDLFSILGSSRIPLISNLLLDMAIVLQPSYPSFSTVVNSVRARLDGAMHNCPLWFVKEVWKKSCSSMSKDMLIEDDGYDSGSSEGAAGFAASVREKAVTIPLSIFARLSTRKTVASLASFFAQGSSTERILSRSSSGFESEEEEEKAKKMIVKSILFTHWCLELAAISQQSCWSYLRRNSKF